MINAGWYLLKATLCSAVLYGYYYAALRDKIFHQWNRFYLLASVVLSLILPLIRIPVLSGVSQDPDPVVRVLRTISTPDEIVLEFSKSHADPVHTETLVGWAYLLVSLVLAGVFLRALAKLGRLKRQYPAVREHDILFISTDAAGTPFSFFRALFWNNAIDLRSTEGRQIFQHEIVHIREKHSHDKLFLNIVLIAAWANPFFWLIRRELTLIHEFIADSKSVSGTDSAAFAAMLLQTIYPGHAFPLANRFFHSSLKRRLRMFDKNNHPRVGYISRLVALPVACILFAAFAFKAKPRGHAPLAAGKKITVVIDAGHGGSDQGAVEQGILEKNINLAIASDIRQLNQDDNLDIVLTRSGDENLSPRERTAIAADRHADLLISIHANIDAQQQGQSGLEVFVANRTNPHLEQSQLLGSSLLRSLQSNLGLKVSGALLQPQSGVWVLNAAPCPSVLIEAGYMDQPADLEYLTKASGQQAIARDILDGIEQYRQQQISAAANPLPVQVDSPPPAKHALPANVLYIVDGKTSSAEDVQRMGTDRIKSVTVLKGPDAVAEFGERGKNGVIEITTLPQAVPARQEEKTAATPLYVIDGKIAPDDALKGINPQTIESISVLKDQSATSLYGDRGKNGVILITLKHEGAFSDDGKMPDIIFTKTEEEARFPGGQHAWSAYINGKLREASASFDSSDYGTCNVRFIIRDDGSVTHVEAVTMKDTHLAGVAVEAIRTGQKWIPARQNGHSVAAARIQPVSLEAPSNQ